MIITSPSFEHGAPIPKKFTCDGANINPELQIQNVPEDAKSLALVMHDPDAPRAGGFTHWVMWNISPRTVLIKQESMTPGSTEGTNDGGKTGYAGPCPPTGPHHYEFKLYALDTTLNLPTESGKRELETAIKGHVLEQGELMGTYLREK